MSAYQTPGSSAAFSHWVLSAAAAGGPRVYRHTRLGSPGPSSLSPLHTPAPPTPAPPPASPCPQNHSNEDIYDKAVAILESYFDVEEGEEENLAPAVDAAAGAGGGTAGQRAAAGCGDKGFGWQQELCTAMRSTTLARTCADGAVSPRLRLLVPQGRTSLGHRGRRLGSSPRCRRAASTFACSSEGRSAAGGREPRPPSFFQLEQNNLHRRRRSSRLESPRTAAGARL